jgi:hypothetical protein
MGFLTLTGPGAFVTRLPLLRPPAQRHGTQTVFIKSELYLDTLSHIAATGWEVVSASTTIN